MNKKVLTIYMLVMINVAAICNIANLPLTAQYGFASFFYYFFGAILFFIPVGLVSAELATGWPEAGGVYVWVRKALGDKLGFVAIWLQWAENVIWYPTTLAYTASTLAYIFDPALVHNRLYIALTVLLLFWGMTLTNFLGMKVSGWISTLCVIVGIIIPGILIISMGVIWIAHGNISQITYTWNSFLPDLTSLDSYSFLAGLFLIFGGLEMSAVHAQDVNNPRKSYPVAIAISTIIIVVVLSTAALSIATVVPRDKIHLASGSIEAIRYFLDKYNLDKFTSVIAFLMTIGSIGTISTWIVGPSKGLLSTARHGELPPLLQKKNKKNMPSSILIGQAIIVTLLALVYLYMPSISSTYRMLFSLSAQMYLIMYLLMFISGVVLRYKYPTVKRGYKIPFGNYGIWVVSIIGILSSLLAMSFGFFAPSDVEHPGFFSIFMGIGLFIFVLIPLLIHKYRRPSWHIYSKE